jgi:hypothetical protein
MSTGIGIRMYALHAPDRRIPVLLELAKQHRELYLRSPASITKAVTGSARSLCI